MKKTIFLVLVLLHLLVHSQTPGGVRGASIWYKTTDNTFKQGKYEDYSEYKNKISVKSESNRPGKDLFNYNESLLFDGLDDYLSSNIIFEDKVDCVIFTVQHNKDSISERTLFYTDKAYEKNFLYSTSNVLQEKSN